MRVFVINLEKHADRRAAASKKMADAGVSFEFYGAIAGTAAVERGLFDGFDDDEFVLNTGRRMTPGEIGCYASHRELWALCVSLNEPIVILEDDFDLLNGFADALKKAASVIAGAGFVRLQTDLRAKKRGVLEMDHYSLWRYTKPPHGLMGYCIAPHVAQRFVAASCILDAPVDVFTKKYWDHGQPMYVLTPYSVAPSVLHASTTIAGRQKTKKSVAVAIRRLLRKTGWYLKRWRFNLTQRRAFTTAFEDYAPPGALPGIHFEATRRTVQRPGVAKSASQ